MIYNTKEAFDLDTKDVPYLEAGIHEDVDFVSARKGQTKAGAPLIEFTFSKNGQTLIHTEYEPTKFSNMTDEDLEERAKRQARKILQIMSIFYDKSALDFTTDSFNGFADWVVSLMNNAAKKKLRIKAVYNSNGFVGLPNTSRYTFIESMETNPSKIRKLADDKFERPTEADREKATATSSEVFGVKPDMEKISNSPF